MLGQVASADTYRTIVAACDQAIAQRLTEDECIVSFTIDGEVITKHGLKEILDARKVYATLLARIRLPGGRGRGNLGSR